MTSHGDNNNPFESDKNITKTAGQPLPGDRMGNRRRAKRLTQAHQGSEALQAAQMAITEGGRAKRLTQAHQGSEALQAAKAAKMATMEGKFRKDVEYSRSVLSNIPNKIAVEAAQKADREAEIAAVTSWASDLRSTAERGVKARIAAEEAGYKAVEKYMDKEERREQEETDKDERKISAKILKDVGDDEFNTFLDTSPEIRENLKQSPEIAAVRAMGTQKEAIKKNGKRGKTVLARGESITDHRDIMSAVDQAASETMPQKDHHHSPELESSMETSRAEGVSDEPIHVADITEKHIDDAIEYVSHMYEGGTEERYVSERNEKIRNKIGHNFFFQATAWLNEFKAMIAREKKDLDDIQTYWDVISGRDEITEYELKEDKITTYELKHNFYLKEAEKCIEDAIKKNKQYVDTVSQDIEEEGIPEGPVVTVEQW